MILPDTHGEGGKERELTSTQLTAEDDELDVSDVSNVEKRLTCGITVKGVDACLAHVSRLS